MAAQLLLPDRLKGCCQASWPGQNCMSPSPKQVVWQPVVGLHCQARDFGMLHAELEATDLPQEAAMHLQIVWKLRRVEVVGCCGHLEDVICPWTDQR